MNKLNSFLYETIAYYANFHSDEPYIVAKNLPCDVIKEYASLRMEDDELIFLTETDQQDMTQVIMNHFKANCDDTLLDLDEAISNAAIKYYLPQLQEDLNHNLSIYRQEMLIEAGYSKTQCNQTGEIRYTKGTRRTYL